MPCRPYMPWLVLAFPHGLSLPLPGRCDPHEKWVSLVVFPFLTVSAAFFGTKSRLVLPFSHG
ncbi:hypothetical protein GIB67_013254 [Kingdonia uniflora]|uniref:Uncharacterized protein n=1 Tax=Kingdonia uniflora TaxID=39325 RepID=A0A7J7N6H9_9MAGN|nr:hypothetical protein GIB67_013254 [Kingdonia uniflora]